MTDKNTLEEKIATREHIITDQGNGSAYCSHCKYNLGSDPFKVCKIEICPGCNYTLTEGKIDSLPGGSDF